MIVIPAVDIKAGKCVRLTQGRPDTEQVFAEDPSAMARKWCECGAEYLHIVDLDAAFAGKPVNGEAVKRIITAVSVPVEVGGGIRTDEAVTDYLEAGADRVVIGTAALESWGWFEKIVRERPGRIAIGIDAKRGMVATRGWLSVSSVTAVELVRKVSGLPLSALIFTDISRDGMLSGPNLDSIAAVAEAAVAEAAMAEAAELPVIASGGVSSTDDIRRLSELPLAGVIVGKALYTGQIDLAEAIALAR